MYIYRHIESTVRVNNRLTDCFSVYSGVRQGDKLAPTLFAIYVNDVTTCINQINVGVPFSETDSISALLYADDIVLMAQNAEELQKMINALCEWTIKWCLSLNVKKNSSHAYSKTPNTANGLGISFRRRFTSRS